MQNIFTLSACGTDAERFFGELLREKADLVLDVRLKNTNQLCGFTRRKDLEYLVPRITGAKYAHDPRFAPSPGLLEAYLKHRSGWEEFRDRYVSEAEARGAEKFFRESYGGFSSVCILGAAAKNRRSHSEILAQIISGNEK